MLREIINNKMEKRTSLTLKDENYLKNKDEESKTIREEYVYCFRD